MLRTCRRTATVAVLALGLASPALAEGSAPLPGTQPADEARAALQDTVERALAILADSELDAATRRERIVVLAEERFDFEVIAKLVVARRWRTFTPEERTAFVVEFKRHLAATYGEQLEAYSDEQVEFGRTRIEKNGDVTGDTKIVGGAAGTGVEIQYRMRGKDGSWYVIDVIVEGVSLVQNFRAQIKDLLRNSTPSELIEKLRKKNESRDPATA